jgi:hypothetical protein
VNEISGIGQIQRGLHPGDAAAHHHYRAYRCTSLLMRIHKAPYDSGFIYIIYLVFVIISTNLPLLLLQALFKKLPLRFIERCRFPSQEKTGP